LEIIMSTTEFVIPLAQMNPEARIGAKRVAQENGVTVKTLRNWTFLGRYPRPEKENPHGRLYWRVGVVLEQLALHGKLSERGEP
jgi:hypothetical protein